MFFYVKLRTFLYHLMKKSRGKEFIPRFLQYALTISIHSSSHVIEFRSCFFFRTDVFAPHRSTLHLLTISVSFQNWDWLWYPMLWSQRRSRVAHEAEISFQISALAGFGPMTLQSDGRERYHSTPAHW